MIFLSKAFEFTKEITVAALQGSSSSPNEPINNIMQSAKIVDFFEKVYKKLKEIEDNECKET